MDGLAPTADVPFMSMGGHEVTVSAEELQDYVKNGQAIIDSTVDSTGEPVGLPIDMQSHDHKGGAGWIKGLKIDTARNVVLFLVEWTEAGAELIRSNMRRFFSPSIDPTAKFILGGSLTNWPASRNSIGQLLLKPVELSQDYPMKGMSMTVDIDKLAEQVAALAGNVQTLTSRIEEMSKPKGNGKPEGDDKELTDDTVLAIS